MTRYLTKQETATALGISLSAVQKAISKGHLHAKLVDGRYRVSRWSVEDYSKVHKVGRPSKEGTS